MKKIIIKEDNNVLKLLVKIILFGFTVINGITIVNKYEISSEEEFEIESIITICLLFLVPYL